MKILINHLTRMHGGHICVAGVDLETRRHVRPVLADGNLPFYLLARYGGPFEMGHVVELGQPRPRPERPHVEDHVVVPSHAKLLRTAEEHEFWNLLCCEQKPSLRSIFGPALGPVGRMRYGTPDGRGNVSLGLFRPAQPPRLYLTEGHGKQQIRIKLADGELHADAGVTDLRLCAADHATPDEALVRGVAKWLADSGGVILAVGLTRRFRPSGGRDYAHYLQVNNLHLAEDPLWRLG
jgi:hypothetical protein